MKKPIEFWILYLSALIGITALSACVVPERAAKSTITMHAWRQLQWQPTSPWKGPTSALYTYVLVGDGASKGGTVDADRARKALAKLLQLIEQSPSVLSEDAPFPREVHLRMNQFCIPTKGYADQIPEPELNHNARSARSLDQTKQGAMSSSEVGLDRYDFKLAQAYRQWFQVIAAKDPKLEDAVLSGSGPYLVATRVPLNSMIVDSGGTQIVTLESPVLILDMSKGSEASVPYYLEAFKEAVRVSRPDSAVLAPMKPPIVEYLVRANQAIPLLEEMWSQSRKRFEVKA